MARNRLLGNGTRPKIATFLLLCATIVGETRAEYVPTAKPILDSLDKSELVVVADITKLAPQKAPQPATADIAPATTQGLTIQDFIEKATISTAGEFDFHVIRTLKGNSQDRLKVQMPAISRFYYRGTDFPVKEGSTFLLILAGDGTNRWKPVDSIMPIIPISADAVDQVRNAANAVDCLDLLLSSLGDAKLRPLALSLIEDIRDKRVVDAVAKFADDKDQYLRESALICMATNQDLRAISKIVRLDDALRESGGTRAVLGLQRYQTPDAVALLNPLTIGHSDYVRINAMHALQRIADATSIPFLIAALDEDDRQHYVPYSAYLAPHRLIGTSIGPAALPEDFHAHEASEVGKVKQWWEWEQIRAKKAAATSTAPASQPDTATAATSPK